MCYTGKKEKKTDKLGNKHYMIRQTEKKTEKTNRSRGSGTGTQNRHTIEFLNIYTNTLT